ncbi:MAG: ParB/RepB/Spo0J family partition protein [Ancrocorticia sp.]
MAERRRGLGRGIGALIPDNQRESKDRPFDVFFGGGPSAPDPAPTTETAAEDVVTPAPPSKEKQRAKQKVNTLAVEASETPADTADIVSEPVADVEKTPAVDSSETATAVQAEAEATPVAEDAGVVEDEPTQEQDESTSVIPEPASELTTEEPADDGLVAVPGATYAELPVESIVPNQRQPRTIFDEDELEELAASIREVGVLQPVIVRPLSEPIAEFPEARYELIMGERRLRASQRAGSETIPAIVRRTADEDLLRDALLENLHRAQLNPLEEAAAYQQLLEDFKCTQEELARRIARSRPQITNTLRLLKLPPLVQRRVAAGVLSAGHARALLGLADAAAMERVAQRIVAESLSVRQVEELVAMGDEPQTLPARRRRTKRYAPELGSLSGRLTDRFDTRVKVDMGVRKGTIKIDFATIEDLNRILGMMSPEVGQVELEDKN